MDTEEWLEEAMGTTNRLLRLVPASFLKECIGGCRRQGVSLEAIAGAGHQLGLIDSDRLAVLQERIARPGPALSRQPGLSAFKTGHRSGIERCRFLGYYLMGVTREIPVELNWQPDEKVSGILGGIVGELAGKDRAVEDKDEEGKHGDSHSNPA
jgi:hypothetical protein